MLLSKNTTSEIVTYGEGANNVRNAIPWSGISDKEIGRYTVTAEYCPVQINVGMPKNPYPLSLADSGVRIIRIRSNQEVPDYFTDPSEKSTDEHLRISSVSGIFKYDEVSWGFHTRPNDSQYKSRFDTSRIDQPQQRFAEKGMFELYTLQLQPGDNSACLIYTTQGPRDRQNTRMPSTACKNNNK